jgi:hypothetical protein
MGKKYRKYKYRINGNILLESCLIMIKPASALFGKPPQVFIGGGDCEGCRHNLGRNTDENWIKCKKIKSATGGKFSNKHGKLTNA